MGKIVTFYSYKGGTGRTMALANVAWILAAAGDRVLVVDWDLEAPGLHRYFHPFLKDKELETTTGIIDIVTDFSVQATTPASNAEERASTWYLPLADVLRYAVSIDWHFKSGQLDLLSAGQQSAAYATRVNSFNWDNFYERLGGGTFLEALRSSMQREYDYVLIDSRTGVSDTSGICTVQMPDQIVVCFTLNRQSIEGAAAIAHSVAQARAKSGRARAQLFPVATRVEKAETVKLEAARVASRERFDDLLWHVADKERGSYWHEVEILYQPFYAYEEVLAAFRDQAPSVGTVLYSMERLAAKLSGRTSIEWTLPTDAERSHVLAGYEWSPVQALPRDSPTQPAAESSRATVERSTTPTEARPGQLREDGDAAHDGDRVDTLTPASGSLPGTVNEPRQGLSFYVSYARSPDDRFVMEFVGDLEQRVRGLVGQSRPVRLFDQDPNEFGQSSTQAVMGALQECRTAVCLLSPLYLASEWCGREFEWFRQSKVPIVIVPWIPLSGEVPDAVKLIPFVVDSAVPSRAMSSGVQTMLRISRLRDDYVDYLDTLAKQIVELGLDAQLQPARMPDFKDLPNAFEQRGTAPSIGTDAVLVFVAAKGGEWRPYGGDTVETLSLRGALEEGFRVDTMEFSSPDLRETLRRINVLSGQSAQPGAAAGEMLATLQQMSEVGRPVIVLADLSRLVHPVARTFVEMFARGRSYGRVILVTEKGGVASIPDAARQAVQETLVSISPRPVVADGPERLSTLVRQELVALRAEILRATITRADAPSPPFPKHGPSE